MARPAAASPFGNGQMKVDGGYTANTVLSIDGQVPVLSEKIAERHPREFVSLTTVARCFRGTTCTT